MFSWISLTLMLVYLLQCTKDSFGTYFEFNGSPPRNSQLGSGPIMTSWLSSTTKPIGLIQTKPSEQMCLFMQSPVSPTKMSGCREQKKSGLCSSLMNSCWETLTHELLKFLHILRKSRYFWGIFSRMSVWWKPVVDRVSPSRASQVHVLSSIMKTTSPSGTKDRQACCLWFMKLKIANININRAKWYLGCLYIGSNKHKIHNGVSLLQGGQGMESVRSRWKFPCHWVCFCQLTPVDSQLRDATLDHLMLVASSWVSPTSTPVYA